MPGLFGLFSAQNSDENELRKYFFQMQSLLNFYDYKEKNSINKDLFLGISCPENGSLIIDFEFCEKKYIGLIDGTIDSVSGDSRCIDLEAIFKQVLKSIESGNLSFLSSINGEYNICIYCRATHTLHIVTDRFALKKIYWFATNDFICFFPDFVAIKPFFRTSFAADYSAIADHILFIHTLDNNTFIKKIKLLPRASVITIDCHLQVKTKQYWSPSKRANLKINGLEECVDAGFSLLKQAVTRKVKNFEKVHASLSGGLDSRILTALAAPEVEVVSTTYGYKKSYECKIAKQVADCLGIEWHHEPIDSDYIEQIEDLALCLNDGVAPAEQLFHIHTINKIVKKIDGSRFPHLSGFYGDLILGGAKKPKSLSCYNSIANAVPEWLMDNLSRNIGSEENGYLFSSDFTSLLLDRKEVYRKKLTSIIEYSDLDSCEDLQIDNIFVAYHARRYLSSLSQYPFHGRELKPFLDYDLYDFCSSIPVEFRLNHCLYNRIIQKYFPKMAMINYASTGNIVGSSATSFFLKKQNIFRKLNYNLCRLTKGKIVLNEPYSYVQFAKWNFSNQIFIKHAKDLLLEDETLSRGIVSETGVTKIFNNYKKGMWVGSVLLNLYFLEKWLRKYL